MYPAERECRMVMTVTSYGIYLTSFLANGCNM
jgi:hypothetical protein